MSNYYLIGSKYGDRDNGYRDIFSELIKKSVIAVGFASNHNLQGFLGKNEQLIISFLKSAEYVNIDEA